MGSRDLSSNLLQSDALLVPYAEGGITPDLVLDFTTPAYLTLENDLSSSLEDSVFHPFFAVELLFDGDRMLRLWTGVGTIVSDDGKEWVGSGNFLNVSSVEETAEMAVKGATLTLSGVPSEVLSLALSEPYQGRVCKLYFGTRSNTAAFTEVFSGYMDQMNIEEGPSGSTVELKVENKLIDLERARVARYSSGYQKTLYPNDLGFDFVEDLQDKKISWGRAST